MDFMTYDLPGREEALVASVTGWRAATGEIEAFSGEEIALLNTPLDYEGGAATPLRSGLLMEGVYQVTFSLAGYDPPLVDDDQGYWIEPIVHHVTRQASVMKAWRAEDGIVSDPVPSNEQINKRVRLARSIGGTHVPAEFGIEHENAAQITIPLLNVIRLGGRAYGWRAYWQQCELDAPEAP